MIQAKSIMTQKVICIQSGASLQEANQLMKEKRFRHLPVIDNNSDVVGIISQRDLQFVPDSQNLKVEMLMSSPVEYVNENETVRNTVFKFLEKKISSLLVTKEDDTIVGIITTDDVLWYLAHLLTNDAKEKSNFDLVLAKQTIGQLMNDAANAGI